MHTLLALVLVKRIFFFDVTHLPKPKKLISQMQKKNYEQSLTKTSSYKTILTNNEHFLDYVPAANRLNSTKKN